VLWLYVVEYFEVAGLAPELQILSSKGLFLSWASPSIVFFRGGVLQISMPDNAKQCLGYTHTHTLHYVPATFFFVSAFLCFDAKVLI
jgi:hypothetical protein